MALMIHNETDRPTITFECNRCGTVDTGVVANASDRASGTARRIKGDHIAAHLRDDRQAKTVDDDPFAGL